MAIYSPITIARFWSKVDVTKGANKCWEWRGASSMRGYGRIKIQGVCQTASRVAWEMVNGRPLGELSALHSCDNPKCCNPAHIFPGTHRENMSDMAAKGRANGHVSPGESNPRAKLTECEVCEIRKRIETGETNISIAGDYGVTHSLISSIRRGKIWRGAQEGNRIPVLAV